MVENSGHFEDVEPIGNSEDLKNAFDKLTEKAKMHLGSMDELERHRQTMDAINDIKSDINLIKRHFNLHIPLLNGG